MKAFINFAPKVTIHAFADFDLFRMIFPFPLTLDFDSMCVFGTQYIYVYIFVIIIIFLFCILTFFSRPIVEHFMGSKSSSRQDMRVIRDNDNHPMKIATTSTVYKVVSGKYVGPLSKTATTHSMKNWSTIVNFKSSQSQKALVLLDSTHPSPNCFIQLPLLGHRMINGNVQWSSTHEFPGEFCYRQKY